MVATQNGWADSPEDEREAVEVWEESEAALDVSEMFALAARCGLAFARLAFDAPQQDGSQ
jgi:hypothetical protein